MSSGPNLRELFQIMMADQEWDSRGMTEFVSKLEGILSCFESSFPKVSTSSTQQHWEILLYDKCYLFIRKVKTYLKFYRQSP